MTHNESARWTAFAPPPVVPADERPKRLADLRAAISEATKEVQSLTFLFVLVGLYIVILAGTTTSRMLLVGTTIQMPILNVGVSVTWAYCLAPALWITLHLWLLRTLLSLARRLDEFDLLATEVGGSVEAHERSVVPAFPFVEWRVGRSHGLDRWLAGSVSLMLYVVAPIAVLLAVMLQFLAYQSDAITALHLACIVGDLVLLGWMWPIINGPSRSWQARVVGATAAAAVLLAAAVMAFDQRHPVVAWAEPSLAAWGIPVAILDHRLSRLVVRDQVLMKREPAAELVAGARARSQPGQEDETQLALYLHPDLAEPVDLTGRHLRHADLSGSRLYGARLEGADMSDGVLIGTDIRRGRLSGAHLDRAKLERARLDTAEFIGASLRQADLTDASLDGALFAGRRNSFDRVKGPRADLELANLREAKLRAADLSGALLDGADLTRANLLGADARGARMRAADLSGADPRGAMLHDAEIDGALFHGARLDGSILPAAKLLDLTSATMACASVTSTVKFDYDPYAVIEYSKVDSTNLEPIDEQKQNSLLNELNGIIQPSIYQIVQQRILGLLKTGKDTCITRVQFANCSSLYWKTKLFENCSTASKDDLDYLVGNLACVAPVVAEIMLSRIFSQSGISADFKPALPIIKGLESPRCGLDEPVRTALAATARSQFEQKTNKRAVFYRENRPGPGGAGR